MTNKLVLALCLVAAPAWAADPPIRATAIAPGFYMNVVDGEVVLGGGVQPTLGDGAPKIISRGKTVVMRRPISTSTPQVVATWRGMNIRQFSDTAAVCDGKVVGFELVGRATGDGAAKDLWNSAERTIVAKLDIKPSACKGAVFARASEAPEPQFAVPTLESDPKLTAAIVKEPAASTLKLADGVFAVVRRDAAARCDRIEVFEQDRKHDTFVSYSDKLPCGLHVAAVSDLDGDLLPELLLEGGGVLHRSKSGRYLVIDHK